ncbi:MAG: hypothetical protein JNL81_10315 [Hyphomonadaceae bacterium]|nr:hypothetical protein [Hyphomonadaceae bacterium]
MRVSRQLHRIAAAAISCATIACTDPAEPQPDPQAAALVGEVEALPGSLPLPSETTPRYVGLWATTAEGCGNPAWRFEPTGVSTQGEVSCEFQNVAMTDSGYDIQAQCHAEGETTRHNIQLSFAESARAMMISGGPWQPGTALVHCGALLEE